MVSRVCPVYKMAQTIMMIKRKNRQTNKQKGRQPYGFQLTLKNECDGHVKLDFFFFVSVIIIVGNDFDCQPTRTRRRGIYNSRKAVSERKRVAVVVFVFSQANFALSDRGRQVCVRLLPSAGIKSNQHFLRYKMRN